MRIRFILFFNLLIVTAYNIDTNYPILYPNSATNVNQYMHTNFQRNYFGYSVLLHRDIETNTSWLLIGAPRGNYTRPLVSKVLNEPGVVYRCNLPGPCVEIEPTVIKDEEIYIRLIGLFASVKKAHSWFGSAMSIERSSGFLTICAPRTTMNITLKTYAYLITMQGLCYSDKISSTTVEPEISEIEHFDYSKNIWFDPIYGFSVIFASLRNKEAISRIVGNPNDNLFGSVNVARFRRGNFLKTYRESKDAPIADSTSKFGYAVTSGYYFDQSQSLYACADPGWNYVGQVAVIDTNRNSMSMIAHLHGSDIGEFFGASLATGDLNNDGLHDLVIGAPHWGNDNGRVYIYLGSPKKEFEAAVILEGAIEDAEFGYAVASGDLDRDGFSDIIVSAPWEDFGVLYVYNGDTSLKNKVRPVISQKITMQLFAHNIPKKSTNVQTFGFSISDPIDIDSNGYPDIAVGAYKSGHVMVLRSKPVVRTNLAISTIPSILQKNVSSFFLEACVEYNGYDMTHIHPFKISLIIDKKYQRTEKTSLELFSTNPPIHMCVNTSISLVDNIQDFVEPIVIYASHNFSHNLSAHKFCKTCPIESRGSKSRNAQILLPFNIECGEDRICHSNISATMKFWGVGENDSWVIGSNDITLETHLQNHAEPAYLTKIKFTFPNGIVLRSILPFCEENIDGDILMIICSVGNPFEANEQKVIKLDLDMRQLTNSSLHGHVLEFLMEIQTRSVNHGTRVMQFLLTLQSEVSLLLNGKATEEYYYLYPGLEEDLLNVTFRHIYQVLKFGASPLEKARLTVNVPAAINDSDSFVFLYKPRIYVSGEYYDCSSRGINIVNVEQNELKEEIASNGNNNETLQNMMHNMHKRDISSRASIAFSILQKLYNKRRLNSEILNSNLTTRESDIVYLNCSTHGANCSTVYCDLSALKSQNVGKLVMRLILNATKLRDTFGLLEKTKIVKFSTDAYVQIIRPVNRIPDIDTRHNVNLTTEFRSIVKKEKVQTWVVLVSISLGFILLCVIIIFLRMMGFFKRITNEELLALKTSEVTENASKMKITNAFE